jgi:hypothetical protein
VEVSGVKWSGVKWSVVEWSSVQSRTVQCSAKGVMEGGDRRAEDGGRRKMEGEMKKTERMREEGRHLWVQIRNAAVGRFAHHAIQLRRIDQVENTNRFVVVIVL